jgi:hypothetical protein
MWMNETKDMTLFVIKKWTLTTLKRGGVRMTIVLKRKIMNEMMTTYLPSVLLILITYATTFFKPYFFEAALSVNLTTMLVMTTIFMTVMQMLPATAYIKMIDIFLIFGQLYPFSEVVLLTMMEYHREGDGSGEEDPTAAVCDKKLDTDSKKKPDTGFEKKPDAASKENTPDAQDEKVKSVDDQLYWYKVTGRNSHVYKTTNLFHVQKRKFSLEL